MATSKRNEFTCRVCGHHSSEEVQFQDAYMGQWLSIGYCCAQCNVLYAFSTDGDYRRLPHITGKQPRRAKR